MFVKPSKAPVGKPSVVASSSGSAKNARYARLLPSTRNSSDSRAGASLRSSSAPVSVFGDISASVRPHGDRPLRRRARRRGGGAARCPPRGAPLRVSAAGCGCGLPGGDRGAPRAGSYRRLRGRRLRARTAGLAGALGAEHLGPRGRARGERPGVAAGRLGGCGGPLVRAGGQGALRARARDRSFPRRCLVPSRLRRAAGARDRRHTRARLAGRRAGGDRGRHRGHGRDRPAPFASPESIPCLLVGPGADRGRGARRRHRRLRDGRRRQPRLRGRRPDRRRLLRLSHRALVRACRARPAARSVVPRLRDHLSGVAGGRGRRRVDGRILRLVARARLRDDGDGLAHDEPPRVALLAEARVPHDVHAAAPLDRVVARVPLLSGTPLVVASPPADARLLRPPPPGRSTDVEAATREALRFPLEGAALEALAARADRVTIVVEPPALPIGNVEADPRRLAIAAVSEALEELGVPTGGQTLLVAGGLPRRTNRAGIAALVTPELRRRFHGTLAVHDAADPALAGVPEGAPRVRLARELVETDLVVVVSAAETVLHGGPSTLVAASDAETQRRATTESLLETSGSQGWRSAPLVERGLAARVPLFGVSVVLNHPHFPALLRCYPYDPEGVDRVAQSPLRFAFAAAPEPARRRMVGSLRGIRTAAAVLAGPPSVVHAEALLRAIELRRSALAEPLDALVIGIPATTPFLPREDPNPLLAAYLGLGHALGLWRDAFPVADGGIVILVHRFVRTFPRPTQQPYHVFFRSDPIARDPGLRAGAEEAVAADSRAIDEYRAGRTVHPLLPFRDWEACRPSLERLGAVYVAGARDAAAARQLGLVPIGGIGAALH